MTQLRARPLTTGEDRYLRKIENPGPQFSSPLSIMGAIDHPYVTSTINSDATKSYSVNLGSGQYIHETAGVQTVKGGITTPELNFLQYSLQFLLVSAEKLGIHYYNRHHIGLIYFQSKYEISFIEGVSYASRELSNFERNRPLLDRWFGPSCKTNWKSPEADSIRSGLSEILRRAKHS